MLVSNKIYSLPSQLFHALKTGKSPFGFNVSCPARVACGFAIIPVAILSAFFGTIAKLAEWCFTAKNKKNMTPLDKKTDEVRDRIISLPPLPILSPLPTPAPTPTPPPPVVVNPIPAIPSPTPPPVVVNPIPAPSPTPPPLPLLKDDGRTPVERQLALLEKSKEFLQECFNKKENQSKVTIEIDEADVAKGKGAYTTILGTAMRVHKLFEEEIEKLKAGGTSFLNHCYYHTTFEYRFDTLIKSKDLKQGSYNNRFSCGVYLSTNDECSEKNRRFGEITIAIPDAVIDKVSKIALDKIEANDLYKDVLKYFLPGNSDTNSSLNYHKTIWLRLRYDIPVEDFGYLIVEDEATRKKYEPTFAKPILLRSESDLVRRLFSKVIDVSRPIPEIASLNTDGWGNRRFFPGIKVEDFPPNMQVYAKAIVDKEPTK